MITIDKLNITSDAPESATAMVRINMPMYNLGYTGTIRPFQVVQPSEPSTIDLWMSLQYPNGEIVTGPPYGIYKPRTISSIKFEISHPAF